jgi:hypothetical protein
VFGVQKHNPDDRHFAEKADRASQMEVCHHGPIENEDSEQTDSNKAWRFLEADPLFAKDLKI